MTMFTDTAYKRLMTAIILAITPLVSFCLDEYVPSLPAMVHALHTTISNMQLTVTMYILSLGLSQWLFGLLSDRYGRRPIFNIGITIALFGTLVCAISNNITMLLLGRLIQAFGMGSAATTFAALTGDCFKGKDLNRVASYTTFVYGLVPIIAPIIGGYIQMYIGWRANFMLMFFVVFAVSFFVYIKLPETHTPTQAHRLEFHRLFMDYLKILSHKNYLSAVGCLIFSWSLIIAFSVIAPFILQIDFKLTAAQYGHMALLIGIAYLIGNSFSSFLMKKLSSKTLMTAGITLMLIGSGLLFTLSLVSTISIFKMMSLNFLTILGVGLLFSCAYGTALSVFNELSGLAGSLIGSLMCFGAVLVTLVISSFHITSFLSFSTIYLLLSILCAVSFLGTTKKAN